MLIREENQEIDENSTVYVDAKGKVLVYRVEKNEGLVNAVTGQKSDIFIDLLTGQVVKKMKIEDGDLDDEMEE
ncbi:hypothetical protein MRB53_012845 [Persea americana]|uniref:Uncharacterized protein n=1 Tax=Persea americana TaxID=3435 RepID=A0ACC2LZE9_PERAE|nr:hypothetical protein MRB53_012845 [Persea americana]